jgi:hypothetical protein
MGSLFNMTIFFKIYLMAENSPIYDNLHLGYITKKA